MKIFTTVFFSLFLGGIGFGQLTHIKFQVRVNNVQSNMGDHDGWLNDSDFQWEYSGSSNGTPAISGSGCNEQGGNDNPNVNINSVFMNQTTPTTATSVTAQWRARENDDGDCDDDDDCRMSTFLTQTINIRSGSPCTWNASPQMVSPGTICGGQYRLTFAHYWEPVANSPTSITNSTPGILCIGNSTTLTANFQDEATAGVTAETRWYTTGCGTTGHFATGNSINVNPTSTATYYARRVITSACGNGNFSVSCASITVTVGGPAPSTVDAGTDRTICAGESVSLSGSVTPACANSTFAANPIQAIPDNNTTGVTSIINIPNSCVTAANITSVYVNITHSWNADLDIYLIAPDGTQIALALDKGGSGDNYNCTFITGGAALPITSTTINGNFAPETPFSSLGAGAGAGNWTLRVFDDTGSDTGTLNSWSITISSPVNTTYSWSPAVSLNDNTLLDPIASPVATEVYTLTATSNGCSTSDNVTVTVNTPAGDPTIFGNNQWNVYAYNGDNANWALNTYRGYYIQPALSATNYGVNTLSFWGNNGSPSEAGAPLGSGNLWNGCDVTPNNHAVIHKRRGFPCGLYEFTMNSWDDPAEVIINGVTVWSCTAWSGSGTCPTGSIGTYSLDAASEVEVRYREFTGGSNVHLDIIAFTPTELAIDGSTRTCEIDGGLTYVNFVDNSGRLIASVNPQGNNLGNVTMTSYVQTAPFQVDACPDPQPQFNTAVLGRRWVITPTTQPASPVRLRLYFHANEYNALVPVANANPNSFDNTVGFFDLSLSKYHNSVNPALVNNSPFDNCPSGTTTIWTPEDGNNANALFVGFDANGLYTEYEIPNFSEFWLHGSSINSPLPVTLTSFNATCEDNGVRVSWSTASELNADYFDVERSRDGVYWETINTQDAAGTTNQAQEYDFMDTFLGGTTVYYRLRQVDNDGKEELYGPVAASCESNSYAMTVFPNPATNSFTVQIYAESTVNDAQLGIYDFTGKAIVQQAIEVNNGVQTYHFNDAGLARGTYIVRIQDNEGKFTPVKLVIQ